MTLRFSVLASGSTGNAVYVETDEQRLLIDAGLSGKKMDELFQAINRNPKELTGILVSHEHSDHIKGVGIFARKHNLPIYANEKTWQAMDGQLGNLSTDQKFIFQTDEVKTFGNLDVESFGVSHDAVEPMFFSFHHEDKKLVLATDMGYVSERIKGTIRGADMFIFESNHDINMLRMGRYPWSIKRRILSDVGHVSNEDAAMALSECIGDKTSRIYLAHLSLDNNMKDLARLSVEQVLKEQGMAVGEQFELYDTDPHQPTALTVVS